MLRFSLRECEVHGSSKRAQSEGVLGHKPLAREVNSGADSAKAWQPTTNLPAKKLAILA